MTKSTTIDVHNLLLGLAWLGELDRTQLARLWFPDKSESTVEKTITRLQKDGLISARKWSVRDVERNVTVPQLARWSLTAAGHAVVAASDQYPPKPQRPRQSRLIAHDARTTETMVRLIEIGREYQLSGLFIAHEVRLDPHRSRPICDALVVLQFGTFDHTNLVPWSNDPAIDDEARVRFAIEADNDTEPAAVIRGKAVAYATLHDDQEWRQWWYAQYGPLPVPLWVVPSTERAQLIQQQWQRAWPRGQWMITDDARLQRNRWTRWCATRESHVRIHFTLSAPALPPPVPEGLPTPFLAAPIDTEEAQTGALVDVAPADPTKTPDYPTAVSGTERTTLPAARTRRVIQAASVHPPTAAEYAVAARQQRTRWTWLRAVLHGVWWLLRACGWLCVRPILLVRHGWAWYQRQGPTTQYLLPRLLMVVVLAGVLGGFIIAHPAWRRSAQQGVEGATVPAVSVEPRGIISSLAPTPTAQPTCGQAHITARGVKLRRTPSVTAPIVRTLQMNEHLTLWCDRAQPEDGYTWLHVRTVDGVDGWAASQWVQRK